MTGTTTGAAAGIFAIAVAACSAGDHNATDAASIMDCTPAAKIQGSSIDARAMTHTVDVTAGTAAYFMAEMDFTDPTGQQIPGRGIHVGVHCNGAPCTPTGPGMYGVGWSVCWEPVNCHAESSGEGEFLKFDVLDASCAAGSFHLVGGPSSSIGGDFSGTFRVRL